MKKAFTLISKACEGFTLIELLVSISIIGILSAIGLATYINFNRNQIVTQAARKVVSDLRFTQSLATNNKKPSVCNNKTLESYTFSINSTSKIYSVSVECAGSTIVKTDNIPVNLTISGFSSVKFLVLKQGIVFTPVTDPKTRTLNISGYGKPPKTITIGDGGDISFTE